MERGAVGGRVRAGLEEARRAPRVLLALFLFSVVVAGTEGLVRVAAPELLVKAIPVFGWLPSIPYTFIAILLGFALASGRGRQRQLRRLLVLMLLMKAVWGVVESRHPGQQDFGNRYLAVSPWRPAWGVAVPLLWVVALAASARRHEAA